LAPTTIEPALTCGLLYANCPIEILKILTVSLVSQKSQGPGPAGLTPAEVKELITVAFDVGGLVTVARVVFAIGMGQTGAVTSPVET
jgi:hypothetical protein